MHTCERDCVRVKSVIYLFILAIARLLPDVCWRGAEAVSRDTRKKDCGIHLLRLFSWPIYRAEDGQMDGEATISADIILESGEKRNE